MNLARSVRSRTFRLVVMLPILVAAGALMKDGVQASTTVATAKASSRAAASGEVVVSNTAQLVSAITTARGPRRILLEPGEYTTLELRSVVPPSEVIITSSDQTRPAVLRGVNVHGGGNLTFTHLVFKAADHAVQYAFLFQDSRNLKFERLIGSGRDGGAGLKDKVILIRDCDQVEITESEFTHSWIAVSLLDTTNVSITSNYFHHLEMDGVRGGGNSKILIAYNYFTDFLTVPPAHPDAIQFWTTNQQTSAHDITIVGNVIVRGEGRPVQGIFMNDEVRTLPYQNLRIEDNVVIGAMYNGISVANATNMVVVNNTVASFHDQKSWIRLSGQMDMRDNRAPIYLIDGKRVTKPERNHIVPVSNDQGAAAIKAWAQGRSLDAYHGNLRRFVARLR